MIETRPIHELYTILLNQIAESYAFNEKKVPQSIKTHLYVLYGLKKINFNEFKIIKNHFENSYPKFFLKRWLFGISKKRSTWFSLNENGALNQMIFIVYLIDKL